MADLCLAADAMKDRVLRSMGLDPDDASSDQKAEALAYLNDGYRRFLQGAYLDEQGITQAHDWAFLKVWADFTITDGTAAYDLPNGFAGLPKPFIHDYASGERFSDIEIRSPESVQRLLRDSDTENEPTGVSLYPKTFTASTGQRWQVQFNPTPDTTRTNGLQFRYRLLADALTDSGSVYPVGGADFCHVPVQGGKAEYEGISGQVSGVEEARFHRFMREAVARDKASFSDSDEIENIAEIDVGYTV